MGINNSYTAFTVLIGLVALQRVFEMAYAKKNFNRLISVGGIEFGKTNYYFVIANQVVLIVGCFIGNYFNEVLPTSIEIFTGLMLFFIGQLFRMSSILTLKQRWTTKIVVIPGEELIHEGVYRYLKHPNYLGVVLESIGLPLIIGQWYLSISLGLMSAIVMIFKIKIEEDALIKHCNYLKVFYKEKKMVTNGH